MGKRRRFNISDYEKYKNRRRLVLLKYRDKEYIPPEQTIIDLLTIFFPIMEDTIEEEAWSVCCGDDPDQEAKRIVKCIRRDVQLFLCRYERQLKKIASEDPVFKVDRDKLKQELNQLFEAKT